MNYKNSSKIIVTFSLIFFLLGGIFIFCFPRPAEAQEENSGLRILYQGSLSDPEENPVEDGNYNMRFLIYDSETEGNLLWQEEYVLYNAIPVKTGKFRVVLGRTKPIVFSVEQGPYWLEIAVGNPVENDEIVWDISVKSRKKIISLSELLKEEKLDYLQEDGLTEGEWESIFQLLEEKLGEQPEMVFLFDLEQLGTSDGGFSSQLFGLLKNLINFLDEKISEMGNKISEMGTQINEVLKRMEDMTLILLNMGEKIDRLYQVLVVDKGLSSGETISPIGETKNYTAQRFERMVIRGGESSIRVFNQSVEGESLIFISFLDDPGCPWWISEKVPGISFNISLEEPSSQDLRFDYWILDEGEQQFLPPATATQNQSPEEPSVGSEEEQTEATTTIEATTTVDNQSSGEQNQPTSSGVSSEEQSSGSPEEILPQNNQESQPE